MARVDGTYWTADFTLARALTEAFRASGKERVLYFCVGDPSNPADRLGPSIGTELLKYYPHVVGTEDEPILTSQLIEVWSMVTRENPDAFVIGIEAKSGPEESLGFIETSDRGIQRRPEKGEPPLWIADFGIAACLWTEQMPDRLTAVEYNRMQRVMDAIVDGQIRFLQKVKQYQPEL